MTKSDSYIHICINEYNLGAPNVFIVLNTLSMRHDPVLIYATTNCCYRFKCNKSTAFQLSTVISISKLLPFLSLDSTKINSNVKEQKSNQHKR